MLGYNSGHFRNMKPKPTEDEVGGFTGNSFPVIVVGRLLMGLITPSPPDQQQNYVELLWKAWERCKARKPLGGPNALEQLLGPGKGPKPCEI